MVVLNVIGIGDIVTTVATSPLPPARHRVHATTTSAAAQDIARRRLPAWRGQSACTMAAAVGASAGRLGDGNGAALAPGPKGPDGADDFDVGTLRTYLETLLPVVMSVSDRALATTLFARGRDWRGLLAAFASEPSSVVLFVHKVRLDPSAIASNGASADRAGEQDLPSGTSAPADEVAFDYTLTTQPIYHPLHVASLALIKRVPTLDRNVSLPAQLHLLSLFGPASGGAATAPAAQGVVPAGEPTDPALPVTVRESPYEALHSVVHNVMAPWFDAYVASKEGSGNERVQASSKSKEADTKMGIPMTKRKFAELELSLLHLQQNVEIPEIHLPLHAVVRGTVDRCHTAGQRVNVDEVRPPSMLQDTTFLNKLQSDVNTWVKEIQTVTKLDRDVAAGTASQEVNFWLSMERAQESIEQQLRSDPIVLTLDILKHAKRFHATVSFYADTGLKDCAEKVHNYNLLMKDFPLNELLSATDLAKCVDALGAVFGHLNKKLRISPYPVKRAIPLTEAISRDLNDTLLKIISSRRLMYLDFAQFCETLDTASDVFQSWDEHAKEFVTVARELTRRRMEKFLPIKVNAAFAKLRERISYVGAFRKTHEQLRVMVSSGSKAGSSMSAVMQAGNLAGIEMTEEINAAYESVKAVDVLDVSQEGQEIWTAAESAYNERVARVENTLIARLRDMLGQAKSAREMLRVFSQFNSLFVRPKVRGAVQEYQQQLLQSVKADIQALQDKFKAQYRFSDANHMSQLRDLPEIAGAIIWARQIERQLNIYMRRVEDVLGKGWELYAEGQKLANEGDTFRRKLDTRPLFEGWLSEINRREMNISGRIFEVTRNRASNSYKLSVNFDSQVIALFKEVRNLIWLGFQIPHTINNLAKDAKRVYPHAVSLMETVRTYSQTCAVLRANPAIACLIAQVQTDVQSIITQGMTLRWENFANSYDSHRSAYIPGSSSQSGSENRQVAFVRQFASFVGLFQDKVNDIVETQRDVLATVDEMAGCPFVKEEFSARLQKIQATIDRLNLEGYPNLDVWVANVDERVERIFETRLRSITLAWCDEFARAADERSSLGKGRRKQQQQSGQNKVGTAHSPEMDIVKLPPLVHEVRIQNQIIYLDPPIEHARAVWVRQLHETWGKICGLRRVQSSRFEMGLQMRDKVATESTYVSLLGKMSDVDTLRRPYALIHAKIAELSLYVAKWLQFQSLWDLEAEHVYARLGDSLAHWQQLLAEIRRTRSTFDNADTQRSFGIAVVDYEQVQSKVNAKYDAWQRDLLGKFGSKLGNEMREVHAAIHKARADLEQHSIEGSSTAQTVTFITFVQDLKRKVKKWAPQIEIFSSGQKTLERQRYMFGQDWLYVDQVEGEWSAFNEILNRKNAGIQEQLAGLQMKITAEDKIVGEKISALVTEWEQSKPIQGTLKADEAMGRITNFELRLGKLTDDRDLVVRAKEAIDLEHSMDNRMDPVGEELRDLKAVWTALSGTYKQLNELRESSWGNVQPRKIRQQLDALIAQTKDMPSRMRQYAAFEYVQEMLRSLLKSNAIVSDLKSDAMRERHWRGLFKQLKQGAYTPSSMTLGKVWDLDVRRNEQVVKSVIATAQGEMALEEYLRQVREAWSNYTLDLVNYQNKCKLIRGWDNLFQLAGDNLNALRAMSMSPHYKVFEEEASVWEDRLSKISVLFDTWIDVQRQWVYLEGIFSGSAEIRHILPVESARFNNINTEFLAVMKKVYKSPFVLDVLNIPGVQKSLERLADLLGKIQKALGEYLERERALFPRFYFVGDEDLLEIIGNSKDIVRIMKHFKKMFAGLSSVTLDDEGMEMRAMVSREGEEVPFRTPVSLREHGKINEWLTKMENEMRLTLAVLLREAVDNLESFFAGPSLDKDVLLTWTERFPAQLVVLAVQIVWTKLTEGAIDNKESLEIPLKYVLRSLDVLADTVLSNIDTIQRRKCEHLITELVNQRDILRDMLQAGLQTSDEFAWLSQMRFYLDKSASDPLARLRVEMANASFPYGFEYLGITDKLVTTPLTRRCYLTLTQALHYKLGGAPEGPAGTGKTETVKALGAQLGQMVLVFCCDETFDFQAMGRIFVGLCRTGGWGCFDEFNRLEERILSAVSQQIQAIQSGLALASSGSSTADVELLGKTVAVSARTAIAVTSNPTYAGRSKLPDNLKKLFRPVVMSQPDREIIAQVLLYAQGFRTAEKLSSKIVPFFNLCAEQLSDQPHYDFGLRALKSVLVSAGQLKREHLMQDEASTQADLDIAEQEIVIQSVSETIVPKLVAEDVPLLSSLLADVFPGIEYKPVNLDMLKEHIEAVCRARHLVCHEDGEWMRKVVQLYQIQKISHGLMMVGPSGTGKSQAWQVLLAALERLENVEGVSYVIDPKAVPKEALYGTLDPTTREWNDGLFTHVLRKIVDNVRGESNKRHWIVFDGDVDPEWVENLNSVLDDNKLLTLPNGERLALPPNVRIMFEVEHLRYATLATVSRCGMVWFSDKTVRPSMMYTNYLERLRAIPLASDDDEQVRRQGVAAAAAAGATGANAADIPELEVQRIVADVISPFFEELVDKALEHAAQVWHIMDFTAARALNTLFSLINKTVRNVLDYNNQHSDFPLSASLMETYAVRRLIIAIVWSFTGDAEMDQRTEMGEFLRAHAGVELPPIGADSSLIDYDVQVKDGEWFVWTSRVPTIEVETNAVLSADVVIPTTDTIRHEDVLYSWLSEHKPLMLCGPPGSGKTMTLFSALRKLPDQEVVGLNFSSATTPELILKTFEQYCEYRKTPNGIVLAPVQIGKWIVLFCDEINLPSLDKYGTQRVISFLRQLVESGGFWRTTDKSWVALERIQFVGACNPPTDPGRVPLSQRFLRHAPLVMVGYPARESLMQIYGTFNRALLKVTPNLRGFAEPLTAAMIDFYLDTQRHFTPDKSPTYVYSPRELTRWMRGVLEIIGGLDTVNVEILVRVWAYEAERIFADRLIDVEERTWTDESIDETARRHFPTIDHGQALARPIVFSNWLSRTTQSVEMDALRSHTSARLRQYSDEELDTKLVLFDSVLLLATAIDRVLRQRQGHLLLIGVSGSGRTTIARFVAWMNGLSVFTIATSRKYTMADFDDDLRIVLKRAGCQGEKISFIIDESQIREPAFLERMNTLLANSEVPGLFEGDEYSALITACKEGSSRDGLLLDSNEELLSWFSSEISKNLHVIFTMNPIGEGMGSRAAASPALFNRCVLLFCFG